MMLLLNMHINNLLVNIGHTVLVNEVSVKNS